MARDEFQKGFALGALLGGFAGALTALLLAPKRGEELRGEIAHHSERFYEDVAGRIKQFLTPKMDRLQVVMNEGRRKSEAVVGSAKAEAEKLIAEAERLMQEAQHRVKQAEAQLKENLGALKEATQVAAKTFQVEIQKGETATESPQQEEQKEQMESGRTKEEP